MKKKVRVSAEVLEQLKEHHPKMAEEVRQRMDDKGRIEVRDEVWNRQDEEEDEGKEKAWPELIDTGLTIGDLLGMLGKI